VGFRWFVVHEASRLGLVGWVANAPDGSVVLEAEGDEGALGQLVERLGEGPPGAVVNEVLVTPAAPRGTDSRFEVRVLGHRGD
jgi:acylphosphatase